MISLDVGCGWRRDQTKRGVVGIDLHRGKCDVVADAHHLPFQNNVFKQVYLWAVLEHLDNPPLALQEVNRVSKPCSAATIMIPINSNVWHVLLKRTVVEFPWGYLLAVQTLLRLRKLWKQKGASHKWQISLSFLGQHFDFISIRKTGQHSWLSGRKGAFFRWLLKGRQLGGYDYVIEAVKKLPLSWRRII